MENNVKSASNRQFYTLLLAGLLVYSTLSLLAGKPATANMTAFVAGLVILCLVVLALFGISWYLLFKPLPAGLKASPVSPVKPIVRQALGIWFVFAGFLGLLGGIWDVAWHMSYGLPFGVDFFWRPHQFIYVALFSPIAVAAYIAWATLRNGKGTLQQRFRADMPLSMIMMAGIFMAFALPADPIWHILYAEDLTGLSIPHTVFSLVNILLAMGYLSVLQSYQPALKNWEPIWKLSSIDATVLLFTAFNIIGLFFATLGDYEAVKTSATALPNLPALVNARPVWALPFLAVFVVTWIGATGSHAIKRYGIASLAVVLAALVRQILNYIFANHPEDFSTWFFVLPIAVAVDLSFWYGAKRGQLLPLWLQALFVSLIAAIATVPQIPFAYAMPAVTLLDMPIVLVTIFLAAYAGLVIAEVVGTSINNVKRQENVETQRIFAPQLLRAVAIIFLIALALGTWFILTAVPPIA